MQPEVEVNACAYTRGLYLFGCSVFGDTWITNKVLVRVFLLS